MMRASIAVAILCLAAEVALPVALPLPVFKFEHARGRASSGGRKKKTPYPPPAPPRMIAPRPEGMSSPQPPTSLPKPKSSSKRPKKTVDITFLPPQGHPMEPRPGHQPQTPQSLTFKYYSPQNARLTSRPLPAFRAAPQPNPEKPPIGSLPHQPQTNMPPAPPPKPWYWHPYTFPEDPPPPPAPRSFVESPPIVERELLEHNDRRIELATRATVRELLTASMDDLD